jgi:hypothetical protein
MMNSTKMENRNMKFIVFQATQKRQIVDLSIVNSAYFKTVKFDTFFSFPHVCSIRHRLHLGFFKIFFQMLKYDFHFFLIKSYM